MRTTDYRLITIIHVCIKCSLRKQDLHFGGTIYKVKGEKKDFHLTLYIHREIHLSTPLKYIEAG